MTTSRIWSAAAVLLSVSWLLVLGTVDFGCLAYEDDELINNPGGDTTENPLPGEKWVVWRGQEILASTSNTDGDTDLDVEDDSEIEENETSEEESETEEIVAKIRTSTGGERKNAARDFPEIVDSASRSGEDVYRLRPGADTLSTGDPLEASYESTMEAGDVDNETEDDAEVEIVASGDTLLPVNTADWGEECYRTNQACSDTLDCLVESNSGLSFCSNSCTSDADCSDDDSTGCCSLEVWDEQSASTQKYCHYFCEQNDSSSGFGTPCKDNPSVCLSSQSCLSDDELDISFCTLPCENLGDCPAGTCCVILSDTDAYCAPATYCEDVEVEAPDQTPSTDGELSERACSGYLTHCNGALETYFNTEQCRKDLECLETNADWSCSSAVSKYMRCLAEASNVYLCLDCAEEFSAATEDCDVPEACAK